MHSTSLHLLFSSDYVICLLPFTSTVSCSTQLFKKIFINFTDFTNKGTFALHPSNIVTQYQAQDNQENKALTIGIATGIVIATLTVLTSLVAIVVGLMLRKRSQQILQQDDNLCYAKLHRESNQQMPSQTLHTSNDLYDQLHLSPSTGQAEFISKTETYNKNNSSPHHDQCSINPIAGVDTDQSKSATNPTKGMSADKDKSTHEQPTYAVVDKKKKHIKEKEPVHYQSESYLARNQSLTIHKTAKGKYLPNEHTTQKCTQKAANGNRLRCHQHKMQETVMDSLEEMYTAVRKKTTDSATTATFEEAAPTIPPHTVEELYTAVKKKPKARETDDEVEAPPVPPHTVEELYTAVQKNKK